MEGELSSVLACNIPPLPFLPLLVLLVDAEAIELSVVVVVLFATAVVERDVLEKAAAMAWSEYAPR